FGDFDVKKARACFAGGGIDIYTVQVLSASDDIGFKRGYEVFRDMADVLIIADGADFDLKETVAGFSGSALLENENARAALESRGCTDFSGALMPAEATFIPNEFGEYQGFALDERDFTLITLPAKDREFFHACEKYALPYLAAKIGVKNRLIFKCFGNGREAEAILETVKANHAFNYSVSEDCCDLTVSLSFETATESEIRAAKRDAAFALKDICYADGNATLSETLFTLLKLSGKTISVAESFTGGRVAAEIVKNSGVSAHFCEGIVAYSNESKQNRLSVPERIIKEDGAVSAKTAYRMAAGLYKNANPDIVVATTGVAGPDGDGTDTPVGRCFIAAGGKNGIHTYKFDFTGDREEITEKGVNAALFFAVKTIKNL
ncbi:MAG: nicotinamide-nucleotide amidohydrolase family protein, partial [Clostridia bacterium]|nr:nicotinamide-nucleotide amidohydrolase family protein [Clostridia bacterium]